VRKQHFCTLSFLLALLLMLSWAILSGCDPPIRRGGLKPIIHSFTVTPQLFCKTPQRVELDWVTDGIAGDFHLEANPPVDEIFPSVAVRPRDGRIATITGLTTFSLIYNYDHSISRTAVSGPLTEGEITDINCDRAICEDGHAVCHVTINIGRFGTDVVIRTLHNSHRLYPVTVQGAGRTVTIPPGGATDAFSGSPLVGIWITRITTLPRCDPTVGPGGTIFVQAVLGCPTSK
jgi:hypothetical protein